MGDEDVPVYIRVADGERIYQGDLLSNLIERQAVRHTDGSFEMREVVHAFAFVTTQDCDLDQDARARADASMDPTRRQNALLEHFQLLDAYDFAAATSKLGGSDIRKRARQNKDERYHFASPLVSEHDAAGTGAPALLLDFKRTFSYPAGELIASINAGEIRRRARLATPYVEHLASRVGYFTQRVALPRDHHDIDESMKPRTLPPGLEK